MRSPEMGGFPPEQPPKEEKPKREFVVGAKKNPDGTMDYSRAMTMADPEGKFAKAADEAEERRKQERAKKLEIPAEVKPGTQEAVWYNLRNTIFINNEVVDKASKENKPVDARRAELIKKLKIEQSMLGNPVLWDKLQKKIVQEAEVRGEKLTDEQIRERLRDISALEMSDAIQEFFVDRFQAQEDQGEDSAILQEGHFTNRYPVKDLIKTAQELQSRLLDESSRGNSQ